VRCTVAPFQQDRCRDGSTDRRVVAALTIYDMCKALSHDIVITGTRLAKRGGKRDFAGPTAKVAA
jgi:cyclic pyranopterin phosphate synthase